MAGSLDQAVAARAGHGRRAMPPVERGCELVLPQEVEEVAGRGIRGTVGGQPVALGKAEWVGVTGAPRWARAARRMAQLDGALTVFVAVDGRPAGVLVLDDPLRPDAARTIRGLRQGGIERVVMVTGDRAEVADTVGAVIGVDAVLAERSPAEKLDVVTQERRRAPTIMVGDGINDAPALALADVGVAMGVRGATASSEAADIVLTVDRLDRVGEAVDPGPTHSAHRAAECDRRDGHVPGGDGGGRGGSVARCLGRDPPGGHRRRGHPQRPAGPHPFSELPSRRGWTPP